MPATIDSPSPIYISETRFPPRPTGNLTPLPVSAGVEIECNFPPRLTSTGEVQLLRSIRSRLRELGISACTYPDNFPQDPYSFWNIGLDGSCGMEHRSPIFRDLETMKWELRVVCAVLAELGVTGTNNCGLHVHLGTDTNATSSYMVSRFHQYLYRNEDTLFRLVPSSRRGNHFCSPITSLGIVDLISAASYPQRSWSRRSWFHQSSKRTTEIRIQKGSLDADYIYQWICLLEQLWLSSQAAPFDREWRLLRLINTLPPEVLNGFRTQKEAKKHALKMLRPGKNALLMREAQKYVKSFISTLPATDDTQINHPA